MWEIDRWCHHRMTEPECYECKQKRMSVRNRIHPLTSPEFRSKLCCITLQSYGVVYATWETHMVKCGCLLGCRFPYGSKRHDAVQNPTRFALFTRGAEAAESCQWFHFPSENQHQEPTFPSCLSKVRCSFAKMRPELFSCLVRAVDATWSELNNWSRRRCHLWSWKVKVVTCKFCKHPGAQSLTAD